jgi:hypothetical protein
MHPYDPDVVRMMLMMVGSVPIVLYYVIRRYRQGKPLIDPSLRMLAVTWAILVLVFGEQLLVTFGNLSPEADRQLAPSIVLLIFVAAITSLYSVPQRQLPRVLGRIFRTWLNG